MFDTNMHYPLYLCVSYDSDLIQSLFAFTNYIWLVFLIEACCVTCGI